MDKYRKDELRKEITRIALGENCLSHVRIDAALAILERELDAAWEEVLKRSQTTDRAESHLHALERRVQALGEKWLETGRHVGLNLPMLSAGGHVLSLLKPTPPKPMERMELARSPGDPSDRAIIHNDEWNTIVDYLCEVAPHKFKKAGEK